MSSSGRSIPKRAVALPLLTGHLSFGIGATWFGRAGRCGHPAGAVRAWQWRSCGAVDHDPVDDGERGDAGLIDGKEPVDVKPGVPTDSVTTLRLPAAEIGRPVVAMFNQERIVARAWPAAENRIAVAELAY
jgi:hypothetical protein